MNDSFNVAGKLKLELKDSSGNVLENIEEPNLVVSSGKEHIASRVARIVGPNQFSANLEQRGNISAVMNCIALGNSTAAVTVSDIKLGGAGGVEMGRQGFSSTVRTANAMTFVSIFGAGLATGTIREAGIFNQNVANFGNMLCRTTFSELTKGGSDSLTVTWVITIL